jgi:hypothetical protein
MIAVLAVAACSTAPDRATTISMQPAAATPAQTPVSQAPKPKGAGDQLTSTQAKAALLTVADLPAGWASEKSTADDQSTSKIEPVACQTTYDELTAPFDELAATSVGKGAKVKEKATFSKDLSVLEMQVSSFETNNRGDQIKNLGERLTKCAKMTFTKKGVKTEMTLSPLSFPNLGDQSLAVRMNEKFEGMDAVGDFVFVATGHNTVSLMTASLQPFPGTELEKIARSAMTKLAVAAKS